MKIDNNVIFDNQSAKRFGEAYPLGNGHLGAMIYGDVPKNLIELSENTFYSGCSSKCNNQTSGPEAFKKMREQALKGDYKKVHELAESFIGIRKNYGTNLPVGSLWLDYSMNNHSLQLNRRQLDIKTGVFERELTNGKTGQITETIFTSAVDYLMAVRIVGNEPFNISIRFEPANKYGKVIVSGEKQQSFTCFAYETMHCDNITGVTCKGSINIISDGIYEDGIYKKASYVYVFLDMKTDFLSRLFNSKEQVEKYLIDDYDYINKGYSSNSTQELKQVYDRKLRRLSKLDLNDFDKLLVKHKQDMQNFMNRSELVIEGSSKINFMFQYGKYLLLCSSRHNSLLPAHLQGIWNDNVACRIGWTCDMHLDINTQMNYWPANIVQLEESCYPLFRWIEKILVPKGRQTARESYGLNGWVAELVSNAWGYSAPYWASPIAPCPTGGVWVMMTMWDYYCKTQNHSFLLEHLFPICTESVSFFLEYVFEDDRGRITTGPSISPENSFIWQGKTYQISNGCTYEIIMVRELLEVYLKIIKILELKEMITLSKYVYQIKQVKEILKKLLPYQLTNRGTINEYSHSLEVPDLQHRHTSHLLGVYPFAQITPEKTPELTQAVIRTLEEKMNPKDNWEDTGWARSLMILYEARLNNGDKAYKHIQDMMTSLLEPNGLIYHPPTRGADAFDHVYELDGNTGLLTSICEMLLQSHNDVIQILPALPKKWASGKVTGLMADGGIKVDIKWQNNSLQQVVLTCEENKNCKIKWKEIELTLHLIRKEPYIIQIN